MLALLPQTKPEFLRDVVRMKRSRGDTDVSEFIDICRDFASGSFATIEGAARHMRRQTQGKSRFNEYWRARFAFLADLDAVLDGSFGLDFMATTNA
ncbi:hypothetical protein C8D77_111117 [Mesorhizobium loti]|uniref:Uncharacterized protein n=1 Tax=Rhizobium loti TaxID=381 RepID=A0A8E2WAG4_RHILI|nr:hypothetical protein [Mesorhizobium loti]PWJ88394.1 hypothetical protein C8D77_111117 [Mesorhizobium loti]